MSTAAERDRARQAAGKAGKAALTGTFDEGDPTEAARQSVIDREMAAATRRRAEANDQAAADQYRAGRDAARADQRARSRSKTAGKAKGKAKAKGRKVARATATPLASARTGTWIGIAAGTLGLVLLRNALQSVDTVTGVAGSVKRGLDWLQDPDAIIKFKGD